MELSRGEMALMTLVAAKAPGDEARAHGSQTAPKVLNFALNAPSNSQGAEVGP
jgi:hypothetical protein